MATVYILKEPPNFPLGADHAPVVEGHILIIPKHHYACYGEVHARLDDELLVLKCEVQCFFTQFYAPVVFWEHGIFRQTVYHAHLHCFPWGKTRNNLKGHLKNLFFSFQKAEPGWSTNLGQYFS